MATFQNETKNNASCSNVQKNFSLSIESIWSASVLPWQLALPWQYTGGSSVITWDNQTKN